MRKSFCFFVFLAFSQFAMEPLRGDSARVREKPSGKNKNVATNRPSEPSIDQRGTKESPFVIDTEGHHDTPTEANEKAREKEIKNKIDSRTLLATEITTGATVILMFIGGAGVGAALRTLSAIKKQADLMALPYRQWVDYGEWDSFYDQRDEVLVIKFRISNSTDFPLMLPAAVITFSAVESGDGASFIFRKNCLLLPNRQPLDKIAIDISRQECYRYFDQDGDAVRIRVTGDISHIGALKERTEQLFSGVLFCNNGFTRFEEETMHQEETEGQVN